MRHTAMRHTTMFHTAMASVTHLQSAKVWVQHDLRQRYDLRARATGTRVTGVSVGATTWRRCARTCDVRSQPSLQCVSTEVPLGGSDARGGASPRVSMAQSRGSGTERRTR